MPGRWYMHRESMPASTSRFPTTGCNTPLWLLWKLEVWNRSLLRRRQAPAGSSIDVKWTITPWGSRRVSRGEREPSRELPGPVDATHHTGEALGHTHQILLQWFCLPHKNDPFIENKVKSENQPCLMMDPDLFCPVRLWNSWVFQLRKDWIQARALSLSHTQS